jgi:hypothetical protein
MAKITIYNDDEYGRAVRVIKVNPYTAEQAPAVIIEARTGPIESAHCFEVRNGELLVVATAEKDSPV